MQCGTCIRHSPVGRKVVHRDVKPANVLVSNLQDPACGDGRGATVKLCDFGFARWLPAAAKDGARGEGDVTGGRRGDMSAYVVTRWYRAPEVIVDDAYGTAVDIWSYGCTLAELAGGQPLFPGCSSADQLWRITRCLGPLPARLAARCRTDQRLATAVAAPGERGRTLGQRLKGVSPPLLELISACLSLDPARRPSAKDLLRLPYFWDVQRPMPSYMPCPPPPLPVVATHSSAAAAPSAAAAIASAPVPPTVAAPALTLACVSPPEVHHTAGGPGAVAVSSSSSSMAAAARASACVAPYNDPPPLPALVQSEAPSASGVTAAAAAAGDSGSVMMSMEGPLQGAARQPCRTIQAAGTAITTSAIIAADGESGSAAGAGHFLRRSVTAVVRRVTTTTTIAAAPAHVAPVTAASLTGAELDAASAPRGFASRASRLLASLALGGSEAHRRLSGSFQPRGASGSGSGSGSGAATASGAVAAPGSSFRGSTAGGHLTSPLGRTSVHLSANALRQQQQQQQQLLQQQAQLQQQQQAQLQQQQQPQPQQVSRRQQQQQQQQQQYGTQYGMEQQQQQLPASARGRDAQAGCDRMRWTTTGSAATAASAAAALMARGSHNGVLTAADRWPAAATATATDADVHAVRSSLAGASETMRSAIGAFLESSRRPGAAEPEQYGDVDGVRRGGGGAADVFSAPLYGDMESNTVWEEEALVAAGAAARATVTGSQLGSNRQDMAIVRAKPAPPASAAVAIPSVAPPLSYLRSQWRAKVEGSGASVSQNHLASANSLTTISASQLSVICSPQGVPSPSAKLGRSPRHENGRAAAAAPPAPLPLRRGGGGAAAMRADPIHVRSTRTMMQPALLAAAAAGSLSTGGGGGVLLSTNASLLSSFGGGGGGGGAMTGGANDEFYRISMTAAEAEAEEGLGTTAPAGAGYSTCKGAAAATVTGGVSGRSGASASAAAAALGTAAASAALAAARWRGTAPVCALTAPADSLVSPCTLTDPTDSPSSMLGSVTCDSMNVRPVRTTALAAGASSGSRLWNTANAAAPPVSIGADADGSPGRYYMHPRGLAPQGRASSLNKITVTTCTTTAHNNAIPNTHKVYPAGMKLLSTAAAAPPPPGYTNVADCSSSGGGSGMNCGTAAVTAAAAEHSRRAPRASADGGSSDGDTSSSGVVGFDEGVGHEGSGKYDNDAAPGGRTKRAKVSKRLLGAFQAFKRQMRNLKNRALAVL